MLKATCLCGAVTAEADAALKPPVACHCSQCRKTSGHVWASVPVLRTALKISGDVRWFQSSEHGRRGFCPTCGASLFWEDAREDHCSVAAGALETPTGLQLRGHIFCADKGDYYDIADGLPQT